MEEEPKQIDEQKRKELEQAVMIIGELKQQAAIMGANDFEIPALNALIESLKEGECTPEEAIRSAMAMVNRKSDYH